ncbi:hypothetical protein HK100_003392, partial [Physocladia obscura]
DLSKNMLHGIAQQSQEEVRPVCETIQFYINLNARGTVDMSKIWTNMGFSVSRQLAA